jgi:uncharacterized protein (TIGR03435 family)
MQRLTMRNFHGISVIAALCMAPAATAQSAQQQGGAAPPSTRKSFTFDAASVKPAPPPPAPGAGRRGGLAGPGTTDHGRIHYAAISVKALLIDAYDVKDFQIEGPGWLDTERFAIDATMPPDTSKEQLRMMLQNLLAERFKLAIHRETKELSMYSLVVAKNGPKMKDSAEAAVPKDEGAPVFQTYPFTRAARGYSG